MESDSASVLAEPLTPLSMAAFFPPFSLPFVSFSFPLGSIGSPSLFYSFIYYFAGAAAAAAAAEFDCERHEIQDNYLSLREYARQRGVDFRMVDMWNGAPADPSPAEYSQVHRQRVAALRKTQRDSVLMNCIIFTGHKSDDYPSPPPQRKIKKKTKKKTKKK